MFFPLSFRFVLLLFVLTVVRGRGGPGAYHGELRQALRSALGQGDTVQSCSCVSECEGHRVRSIFRTPPVSPCRGGEGRSETPTLLIRKAKSVSVVEHAVNPVFSFCGAILMCRCDVLSPLSLGTMNGRTPVPPLFHGSYFFLRFPRVRPPPPPLRFPIVSCHVAFSWPVCLLGVGVASCSASWAAVTETSPRGTSRGRDGDAHEKTKRRDNRQRNHETKPYP